MNVSIRRFRMEDMLPFYEAVRESAQDAYQWLPWCHPGYSLEDSRIWIQLQSTLFDSGMEYNFLVVEEKTGKILGGTGINSIHHLHQYGMLGYWVRSGYTGKGIATSAALKTIQFGFDVLKLNRIEILIATNNIASKRVAEKTGALYEGIARRKLNLHNVFVDAFVYSVINKKQLEAKS